MAALGKIKLKCPSCGEKLPPIDIDVTRTKFSTLTTLDLKVEPVFPWNWAQQVEAAHPFCVPFDE